MFNNLEELLKEAQKLPIKKMVVCAAHDIQVLESVRMAVENQLVESILIGRKPEILKYSQQLNFSLNSSQIINVATDDEAAMLTVTCMKEQQADIMMKGMVPSHIFLKAVIEVNKCFNNQRIMSHVALMQVVGYHKLFAVTDVAMNIRPGLDEKLAIIENAVNMMHKIGNDLPKVAIIGPYEKVNPKIDSTVHAEKLMNFYNNGRISGCFLDGPLALDNAVSHDAAFKKGIQGNVAGDADILICPDLDSGNVLYKSLVFLAGAQTAAIIAGASFPVVLTSRADDALNKLYSIALAKFMA